MWRHALSVFIAVPALASAQQDWPSFRGDGTNRTTSEQLPLQWDATHGIAWTARLPGYGQSSPAVVDGVAFVTSVEGLQKERCVVCAVDTATGDLLWSESFSASQPGPNNPSVSRAAATPVVDGNGVVAFFESGELVALSSAGDIRWRRSLTEDYGPFKNHHGLGSSPAQTRELVIVLVEHRGDSYLIGVSKSDGRTVWKTPRRSGLSWTSPVVSQFGGRECVVVSSNGDLTLYEATTGEQIASLDGFYGNLIPSPVVSGDRMFVGAGEGGLMSDISAAAKSNCCVRYSDASGSKAIEVLWRCEKAIGHHASPVIADDHVYITNKVGVLFCFDLATGKLHYAKRLDDPCWATPIATPGRPYCFGKDGTTTVVGTSDEFVKLASNQLWNERSLETRRQEAERLPESQFPKLPEQGREMMEAMLRDAIGEVVYSASVAKDAFLIRTGNELICIRAEPN